MLGQYSKMPGKYSRGQPVYRNNGLKDRFFFVGVNGFWYTSYTYGPGAGGYIIATWNKGAWKIWGKHIGTQSVIFEGMNIEDMGSVFMILSIFRRKTLTRTRKMTNTPTRKRMIKTPTKPNYLQQIQQ